MRTCIEGEAEDESSMIEKPNETADTNFVLPENDEPESAHTSTNTQRPTTGQKTIYKEPKNAPENTGSSAETENDVEDQIAKTGGTRSEAISTRNSSPIAVVDVQNIKREKPIPTIILDDSDDECKEMHVCEHCLNFKPTSIYKDLLDHISRKHPKKRRMTEMVKQEPGTTPIKTEVTEGGTNTATPGTCHLARPPVPRNLPTTSSGQMSLYDGNPHGEQTI